MKKMTKQQVTDPIESREREIVRLAAAKVTGYTRRWLWADERSKFLMMARELLAETAEKAKALGLNAKQVDNQIATYLALSATEAQLKSASRA